MDLKKIIKKLHLIHNIYIKNKFFLKRKSYSMEKEDLEIVKIFHKIKKGFYVDVGCYHPIHLNNTFLLYKKNWRGINIDINSFSIELFNFVRPEDINLNFAVSNRDDVISYYSQKKISQLTTIYQDIAKKRMQGRIKEEKKLSKRLTTILNETKYKNEKIDFLNIDAEGADFDILKSLNFDVYRPKLICVEIDEKDLKNSDIYIFLQNLRYTKLWSATFSHLFVDDFFDFKKN